MPKTQLSSEFLDFLASHANGEGTSGQLPSLNDLSQKLGISVARLREQLEVARALGFVEARPRTGIRRLPYSFFPAVQQSLNYAIALDPAHFATFSDLRDHLEAAYWDQAVQALTPEDVEELRLLVAQAWRKLHSAQIQIPHEEHRRLHMAIYRRLNNPFVSGILNAYWEAYEAVGLSLYADYDYLQRVWEYHERMVAAIAEKDYAAGYQALVEHKALLHHRPVAPTPDYERTSLTQTTHLSTNDH